MIGRKCDKCPGMPPCWVHLKDSKSAVIIIAKNHKHYVDKRGDKWFSSYGTEEGPTCQEMLNHMLTGMLLAMVVE